MTTYTPPWPPEAVGNPEWWDTNVGGHRARVVTTSGTVTGAVTPSASGLMVGTTPVRWGEVREIHMLAAQIGEENR